MAIAYIPDIPDGPDKPRDSQPNLQINSNSIQQFLEIDHRAFANAQAGKHNKVSFPHVDPGIPTAGSDEIVVFSNDGVNSSQTELYYLRDGDGPGSEINMTERSPDQNSAGWTSLPSGMKMIWGLNSINTPNTTLTFSVEQSTFIGFSNTPHAQISPFVAFKNIQVTSITAAQINISTNQTSQVFWFCIGI